MQAQGYKFEEKIDSYKPVYLPESIQNQPMTILSTRILTLAQYGRFMNTIF